MRALATWHAALISASSSGWVAARRAPGVATRTRSSPTRSRRSSAPSTSTRGWCGKPARAPALRPADRAFRAAGRRSGLEDQLAGADRGHLLGVPEYLVQESGPDHRKQFTAIVRVNGADYGDGHGRSKKKPSSRPPSRPGPPFVQVAGVDRVADATAQPRGLRQLMPELPEVEVVRRGLERWVVGRRIADVAVSHPRAIRRHVAGADDFADCSSGGASRQRAGVRSTCGCRSTAGRGPRSSRHEWSAARRASRCSRRDASARTSDFDDGGRELRFVDQRTFGGLAVAIGGADIPGPIVHIGSTRSTRSSTVRVSPLGCAGAVPVSSVPCWTSRWSAASATSMRTRRCGGPGCTTPGRRRRCAAARSSACSHAVRRLWTRRCVRRYVVRQPLCQRERRERLLRPLACRLRARGRALPALRYAHPPRPVHEPFLVHLPALPASTPPRPLVAQRRRIPASSAMITEL